MAGSMVLAVRLWAAASLCVNAFPSFRTRVPNGFRVTCPTGAQGCLPGNTSAGQPDSICNGIGHRTCAGATLPLNPFGLALEKYNYTWTRELCEEDSDSDGLTNGEELGDPCCLWEDYDTPSAYTGTFAASHPGVPNVASGYVRPACATTAPASKAAKMNAFNPWEEQRQAEMFIDSYQIPAARTTYVDFAVNFPDESMDLFHVVFAEVILRSQDNLHHFVIKGCTNKWPDDKVGKVIGRAESRSLNDCDTTFGAWAPGSPIVSMPSWLGRPVGSAARIVAFQIQAHFNNPSRVPCQFSNDGFRIHYTPTLRNETATAFASTTLSVNAAMGVPAGKKRFFLTRSCLLDVKDDLGQPAKFHVATVNYHAHLLGREMYSELTQGSQTMDFGSSSIWHFDDQYNRNLLPMNVTLQTGDHIQTTCVFNSLDKTETVNFGVETTDEMCWASFVGWPGNVRANCSGHLWMGELSDDEPGLGLALRHKEKASGFVWDGADLSSGGKMLGGSMRTLACSDFPQAQGWCPTIIAGIKANTSLNCNTDLREYNPILDGQTILTFCCSQACSAVCPGHPLCPVSTTSTTTLDESLCRAQTTPPSKGSSSVSGQTTTKGASSVPISACYGAQLAASVALLLVVLIGDL
ncbi:unnamed protein product [Polarella glacialis]|uniref:Peptidylglycine monooxygenase n=1 Tax=Polarella glacialis TaxID=89957 RepID=A0A813DYU1_POLGL|nr:unnamed protein product [Polarella glacialis]